MRILLDAMGGDNAPKATIEGALEYAKETTSKIVLVGKKEVIEENIVSIVGSNWNEKYNIICEESSYMLGYEEPKESKLLDTVEKAYIEVMGNIPKKKKSQACLECGYLGQKIENLEYIAIAPNIFDAHSPKERVEIASANNVWKIVEKIIDKI